VEFAGLQHVRSTGDDGPAERKDCGAKKCVVESRKVDCYSQGTAFTVSQDVAFCK
jgi:hypothetical protein